MTMSGDAAEDIDGEQGKLVSPLPQRHDAGGPNKSASTTLEVILVLL